MFSRRYFVRNLDADGLIEAFIISAVSSILAIRLYLHMMNYPQIGGGGLHIAHMLWGGLLMLIAIFLLISYLTKPVQKLAVILGGIGFGTFIDELGKFITSDNNYFFQPTIALIYVIFILIYLFSKGLEKLRKINKAEYLMNAFELMKEAIINDLDINEKKRALSFLKMSNTKSGIVKNLEVLLGQINHIAAPNPSFIFKIKNLLSTFYYNLIRKPWFVKIGLVLILINVFWAIGEAIFFIGSLFEVVNLELSFAEKGELLFSIVSVFLVIYGITKLRKSRLEALKYFKYAFLVSIFLTEFFVFYREQFSALINLVLDVLYLLAIEFMIEQENSNSQKVKG